ncbi:hypothetical protein CAPTEDRAFT_159244 [Capitella teleta]|uniref:Neurotransmitter-gated ion-channel ligand-binding domain-containing protein n=1 Tax=Capitella teleta TaxID=283909 RepID=R7TBF0_CAPTE|nr:hypothetical protein CAPTEDRAFT_159244 [Capitella teleta]|eukprot:ELT91068.1 hypothetical protein CAPTEDRAFT_159244 [Capitella teleta]
MLSVSLLLLCNLLHLSNGAKPNPGRVPDEQRLYRDLMRSYESSVRPVINASHTLLVDFKLILNKIVDLDERTQVLTTNVFIEMQWTDEKLCWNTTQYNNIKTLRVPASEVWLPDTFLFNNADDGATGFMQGVYVLLNSNGSILWPVPVKLKSSCKVDIRYFPFDDQECLLRFGSWIYAGRWMDFQSTAQSIDLEYYIDNSEWDLVDVAFKKILRPKQFSDSHGDFLENGTMVTMDDHHPDLVFTLHIRRRTFYYIFNIIVPCVMLSVLTLLTFWLPPTSGEKIGLGLSVFLAFSMFMLLIAEEVPATSESVPLIGVYLTTVMTLTSTSVIMAVMVINLYNRGGKTTHPPVWIQKLVLDGLARVFCMNFDLDKLVKGMEMVSKLYCRSKLANHKAEGGAEGGGNGYAMHQQKESTEIEEDDEEEVWVRRESQKKKDEPQAERVPLRNMSVCRRTVNEESCKKLKALADRKKVIVEWQSIATVIDRILFWIFLLGTVVAYLIILVLVPNSKPEYKEDNTRTRILYKVVS